MFNKKLKIILSAILAATLLSSAAVTAQAVTDVKNNSVLAEISRQFQDKDNYAFDYREDASDKKAKIRTGSVGGSQYPDSFDLRNVDTDGDGKGDTSYVTPVKLQNPFGSCWAFAAIGAAETSVLGKPEIHNNHFNSENLDFSEKHLAWFNGTPLNDPDDPQNGEGGIFEGSAKSSQRLDLGGTPIYATSMFSSGIGPVLEYGNNPKVQEIFGDVLEYHGKKKLIDYDDDGNPFCYAYDDDWSIDEDLRFVQAFRLKETYQLPSPSEVSSHFKASAIGAMKEQLMNKRALEIGFCADSSQPVDADGQVGETMYISDKWAHYTFDKADANHAVIIVGWDDNYPKENFTHSLPDFYDENGNEVHYDEEEAAAITTPKRDGAWLVKNSWGAGTEEFPNRGSGDWGIPVEKKDKDGKVVLDKDGNPVMVGSGYFWISYEDKSIGNVESLDFDKSNKNDYYVYQYDYMPVNTTNSAVIGEKVSTSNIFTAEGNLSVGEITCQTTTPNTSVHYELYVLNDNFADPTDGTKLYEADVDYAWGGFHRHDLDKSVIVKKGQKFSVVVTQKTSDDKYIFATNFGVSKNYATITDMLNYSKGIINKGESMFCANGQWIDMSGKWVKDLIMGDNSFYFEMDNFPIKAYGEEVEIPAEPVKPASPAVSQKKANPLTVTTAAKSVKAKSLKAKKQTVKPIKVKNAEGRLSYKILKKGTSAKLYKKLKINSKGVITLKKCKLKKGTYKAVVKVSAAGNDKYNSGKKTVTIKIRIK